MVAHFHYFARIHRAVGLALEELADTRQRREQQSESGGRRREVSWRSILEGNTERASEWVNEHFLSTKGSYGSTHRCSQDVALVARSAQGLHELMGSLASLTATRFDEARAKQGYRSQTYPFALITCGQ